VTTMLRYKLTRSLFTYCLSFTDLLPYVAILTYYRNINFSLAYVYISVGCPPTEMYVPSFTLVHSFIDSYLALL
jgi:hypothetical protein